MPSGDDFWPAAGGCAIGLILFVLFVLVVLAVGGPW